MEEWRDIPGWEGIYQVSNQGRIRSLGVGNRKGKILKPAPYGRDRRHLGVSLWRNNKGKTMKVHRLVASAFIGPCPDGAEVCHNDGDGFNNRLSNLRYDSQSENVRDRIRHGTHHQKNKHIGARCGHRLESPNLVESKLRHGHRECLACSRAQSKLYHNGLADNWELRESLSNEIYKKLMEEMI